MLNVNKIEADSLDLRYLPPTQGTDHPGRSALAEQVTSTNLYLLVVRVWR